MSNRKRNKNKRRKRKRQRRRAVLRCRNRPVWTQSVAKFGEQAPDEDFAYADGRCIVLSDGAGGSGLFADRWSRYLVRHLDKEQPIVSFEQLDELLEAIWKPFYDAQEAEAKEGDAMLLNKFYSEGSFATLVAAWRGSDGSCRWMSYGDSVLFHYDRERGKLWHSFTKLADFENPPHLISCKDPLERDAFRSGTFEMNSGSVVFATSDALSHLILMIYMVSRREEYREEIEQIMSGTGSDRSFMEMALEIAPDFEKELLDPLIRSVESPRSFEKQLRKWYEAGLLDLDDYTLALLRPCTPVRVQR